MLTEVTDSDEEEGVFPSARKFSWLLVGATAIECVGGMVASVADGLESITSIIVAHERWTDANRELGHQIESLVDVSPFQ